MGRDTLSHRSQLAHSISIKGFSGKKSPIMLTPQAHLHLQTVQIVHDTVHAIVDA